MDKHIILFDGICNFCNFWIDFIIKKDTDKKFLFSPLQSQSGQEFLQAFGFNLTEFETFVVIIGDKYYTRSDAVLLIAENLHFPFRILKYFKVVPKKIRDKVYGVIARNRYKLFGKKEVCLVPGPDEMNRFVL